MLAEAEITTYVNEKWGAAEGPDQYPELWERLRQRWAARAHINRPSVAELCEEYEEATGTQIACD
jgi:hypothetical protein